MTTEERLAPVVDLSQYRRLRNEARHEIINAANRFRIRRYRYVRATVVRPSEPPTLLAMRHLPRAVAICRHWGLVDDATLEAAGFRRRRSTVTATDEEALAA